MLRNASTNELYFVILTVVNWIDIFTRRVYNDLIIENLTWCQANKGLNIYAYVIMTNHIHLIANVDNGKLGDALRDFKTYTSKEILKAIENNGAESRRDWLLRAFRFAGKQNPLNKEHQFWQHGNFPILHYSSEVIQQKTNYIHNNPVKAGFVGSPHEFWYSSANPESPLKVVY